SPPPGKARAMSVIVYLIVLAVSGLVIGALGRLAIPGKDPMTIPQTILVGIAGSFIAGLLYWLIFGDRNGGGILLSVVCAAAIFAIGFGIYELMKSEGETSGFVVAYVVLALAFCAEGTSWLRALRQTRREAEKAGKPILRHARESRDPNVKMVLFEDTVALIGVAVAAMGVGLNEVTGLTFWDPTASVLIGLLLVSVAFWMGRDAKHLLIGSAALPEERETIERVIEEYDE